MRFPVQDTCTPLWNFLIALLLVFSRLLRLRIMPSRDRWYRIPFNFVPVGYCSSVGVRARSLRRPRRAAATTALEFLSTSGLIGDAIVRIFSAGQTALSRAKLYRSLPLLVGQYVGIFGKLLTWIAFNFFNHFIEQRLDIRGRVKILHGQNRKTEEPPLALFAYCTPFGPPSLLEIPQKENMFKSKHKLDLSLVSMDQRWLKNSPNCNRLDDVCPFSRWLY